MMLLHNKLKEETCTFINMQLKIYQFQIKFVQVESAQVSNKFNKRFQAVDMVFFQRLSRIFLEALSVSIQIIWNLKTIHFFSWNKIEIVIFINIFGLYPGNKAAENNNKVKLIINPN